MNGRPYVGRWIIEMVSRTSIVYLNALVVYRRIERCKSLNVQYNVIWCSKRVNSVALLVACTPIRTAACPNHAVRQDVMAIVRNMGPSFFDRCDLPKFVLLFVVVVFICRYNLFYFYFFQVYVLLIFSLFLCLLFVFFPI
jgi:hypothetical protein